VKEAETEEVRFYGYSLNLHQTTRRHIPENGTIQWRCCTLFYYAVNNSGYIVPCDWRIVYNEWERMGKEAVLVCFSLHRESREPRQVNKYLAPSYLLRVDIKLLGNWLAYYLPCLKIWASKSPHGARYLFTCLASLLAPCKPALKVHLLFEPEYVMMRAGNLTEEKPYISMTEFPTGICTLEVCWK
jgi:hypothetical protein